MTHAAVIDTILMDIEGTTTPIAFVRDTLFPYARMRFPDFLQHNATDPDVRSAVEEVLQIAPDQPPLESLLAWMDADAKITPLKHLQGLIWREGYRNGALQGALYPDVAPCLRAWHASGLALFVYSSGSEEAQRLIFGHSVDGNLAPLFDGFFDTRVGGKRDVASYSAIAERINRDPSRILFLSDMAPELDAAASAGLHCCQLVRANDQTIACNQHDTASNFAILSKLFCLGTQV